MQNTLSDSQLTSLTAEQILAIPSLEPEWLYADDADALKHQYRQLAKIWYPDVSTHPRAGDVFKHIDALHDLAAQKITAGTWQKPGEASLRDSGGHTVRVPYAKKHDFALGTFYIGETSVTYVIKPEHKALYDNAVKTIKSLSFANTKMREQCAPSLPRINNAFEAKEGYVLVLNRDPEFISLRDVLDHGGGKVDPRHTAWTLSSLYNLSCYLSWAGLTHNDISPDTVFIGPKSHIAALLGGWWYATPQDRPLSYLPDRTYDHAPPDILRSGEADARVDLGLIRLTGRELLGDASGARLSLDKTVPASLAAWLRMPTPGDAKDDYRIWMNTILKESFGARRYVEMKLSFSDLYKNGEQPWASPQPKTSSPSIPPKNARSSASKMRTSPRPHP